MNSRAHRPQPHQYPPGAPALTDVALIDLLISHAPLTQQQTEAFVGYATQLAAGTMPRLPKLARDHAIAVAKAAGLLAKTEMRARPKPLGHDGFDQFSTRPGEVHAEAARQMSAIPTRPDRLAKQIAEKKGRAA